MQGLEGWEPRMSLIVRDAEPCLSWDGPSVPVGAAHSACRGAHTPRLLAAIFQMLLTQAMPQVCSL